MPAKIRIYGQEATFSQGHWACDDESLQAMLQSLADPRALSEEAEREHALYAAGRYGGLIATALGWEAAPHPEAEIRLEDFQSRPAPRSAAPRNTEPKKGGGLLGGLFRRKG